MTARSSGDPTLFSGAQASSWSFNTPTLLHIDLGTTPCSSNPQIPIDSTVDLRGCRQFAGNQAALPHKYPSQPPMPFGIFSPLSSPSPPPRTHRAPSAYRISTELDGRYVQPSGISSRALSSIFCVSAFVFVFLTALVPSFFRSREFLIWFSFVSSLSWYQHTPRTRQQHREIRKSGFLVLFFFVFPSSRTPRVRVLFTSQLSGET